MKCLIRRKNFRSLIIKGTAGILLVGFSSGLGAAKTPRAIVEEIAAPGVDLEFMDYVHEGQVIDLKSNQTIS